jgi:8-oxo-dGTP diphosphatase
MKFGIAVKGIIRRDDGRILIVKRSDKNAFLPGIWETIGGGMTETAHPKDALAREILKEIGVRLHKR